MRSLIEQHEADPDPLNIFPELAAARALFQDFIERYDRFTDAIVAWHQSYQANARPLSKEKAERLVEIVDQYEELISSEDDLTDRQQKNLETAREFARSLTESSNNKPIQILDIADAYRIVSEVTKIVERIERIRSANAISRPEMARVMQEMARVVQTFISDEQTLEQIKGGWLSIRL
jgi:ABC-type branched-subunit amino acid transport system ATPase component